MRSVIPNEGMLPFFFRPGATQSFEPRQRGLSPAERCRALSIDSKRSASSIFATLSRCSFKQQRCQEELLFNYVDRYIVPTPGKIYWDGLVSAAGKIRWNNPNRAPLLLIGGGIDLIAEAKLT